MEAFLLRYGLVLRGEYAFPEVLLELFVSHVADVQIVQGVLDRKSVV